MTDPIEALEAELLAVVRKYGHAIREMYKNVDDPQAIDGALDAAVASVIRELENYGYYFDTLSLDNVLYLLRRDIRADETGWEVVEAR